jgi:serpin B
MIILKQTNSNIIFSKFSMEQILFYLKNGTSNQSLIKFYDKLLNNKKMEYYINLNKQLSNKIIIANSLWIMKKNTLLKSKYKMSMKKLGKIFIMKNDFNINMQEKINHWVKTNTQNMIQNIDISPNSILLAINVIYFNEEWLKPFNLHNTTKKIFHTDKNKIMKDFMIMTDFCDLYESKIINILCKDYKNDYFMAIVINNQNYQIPLLSENELMKYIKMSTKQKVDIEIPRFTIKSEHKINDIITSNFNVNIAQYYNEISEEPIILTNIIQNVVIIVNENGTTAAALTITKVDGCALTYKQPKKFIANRPFSFYIIKKKSNCILFSGALIN